MGMTYGVLGPGTSLPLSLRARPPANAITRYVTYQYLPTGGIRVRSADPTGQQQVSASLSDFAAVLGAWRGVGLWAWRGVAGRGGVCGSGGLQCQCQGPGPQGRRDAGCHAALFMFSCRLPVLVFANRKETTLP